MHIPLPPCARILITHSHGHWSADTDNCTKLGKGKEQKSVLISKLVSPVEECCAGRPYILSLECVPAMLTCWPPLQGWIVFFQSSECWDDCVHQHTRLIPNGFELLVSISWFTIVP